MEVLVKKKVLNSVNTKGIFYELKSIDFCCKEMKSLFDLGFISFINGNTEDFISNFSQNEDLDKNFVVALVSSDVVDNGDYNYEDEWECNYETNDSFFAIKKCPVCGEDIVIKFEEIDITSEYDLIMSKYPSNKKTKENKELIKRLNLEKTKLLGGFHEY